MVTALHRKLVRELLRTWGQGLTIAMVVACGIASFVTLRSAYASLLRGRDAYYTSSRFADIFASAKHVPEPVARRIEALDGVTTLETRLSEAALIPMAGMPIPATARLLSLPSHGPPLLNAPYLRAGRQPLPGTASEVLLLETFAEAHHLGVGDTLPVVIDGVRQELRIVGLALSPEFVLAVGGGAGQDLAPDRSRFAVLWMDRDALAASFDMRGSFNDLSLRIVPSANVHQVVEKIDAILKPYGGYGTLPRSKQPSSFFVDSELKQLRSYAATAPIIFLVVAAFLVSVVLSRLLALQRPQVATLKALGYSGRAIAMHYLSFVLVIVLFGAAFGVVLGAFLGKGMLGLYAPYFRFPELRYRLQPSDVAAGFLMSVATAIVGATAVLFRLTRLAPALAMQPEAPENYHAGVLDRLGAHRFIQPQTMMVLRDMVRRPLRTMLSSLGIATGIAVVVVGRFMPGALETIVGIQFERAQREDLTVTFTHPIDEKAALSLRHLPGVLRVEPMHTVAVRVRAQNHVRETALVGLPTDAQLRQVIEWPPARVSLPEDGVLLSDALARILDVRTGDTLHVEVLEGDRRTLTLRVSALAREMFGLSAYMRLAALREETGSGDAISAALLSVDPSREAALYAEVKNMPRVAAVNRRRDAIVQFRTQSAESMTFTSLVLTLFGAAIAVSVVYNHARVALSVRGRDLASLRVLGFTKREVASVVFTELGVYVALAMVPGLALGRGLVSLMFSAVDQEIYRMPTLITGDTYALSAAITIAATFLSALAVKRRIDHLDLIAVLKARE